jgi:hypothetical protein
MLGNSVHLTIENLKSLQDINVFFNSSHNASAFGGYDAEYNHIVIAFRGTVDKKNWLSGIYLLKLLKTSNNFSILLTMKLN